MRAMVNIKYQIDHQLVVCNLLIPEYPVLLIVFPSKELPLLQDRVFSEWAIFQIQYEKSLFYSMSIWRFDGYDHDRKNDVIGITIKQHIDDQDANIVPKISIKETKSKQNAYVHIQSILMTDDNVISSTFSGYFIFNVGMVNKYQKKKILEKCPYMNNCPFLNNCNQSIDSNDKKYEKRFIV